LRESRPLSASLEDYLEAILNLSEVKGSARAKEIAEKVGVRAASVTGALRTLSEKNFVNYAPYDLVTLTLEGQVQAQRIARRHRILKEFFTEILTVSEDVAEEGACQVEHAIPKVILDRLLRFVEFVENCPRAGNDWIEQFKKRCGPEPVHRDCDQCISECIRKLEGSRKG